MPVLFIRLKFFAVIVSLLLGCALLPILLGLHHRSDHSHKAISAITSAKVHGNKATSAPKSQPLPQVKSGNTPRRLTLGQRQGHGLLFFSVGDWGGVTRVSKSVTAEMARYAESHGGCSFLMSTGDNFYDDGVANVEDPQWNNTFKTLFGHPQLTVPFLSCLGNHDHRGNVTAQIAYTHVANNGGWYMPDRCYTETVFITPTITAEFFVLNSYDGKKKLDSQLSWLEGQFQASVAHWKFVVNHNPLFSGGSTHGATTGFGRWSARTKELLHKLLPLIKRYKVHAVFSGDDHTLQVLEDNSIAYFVSGAGGGREKGMFHGAHSINQTVFAIQHVGGFMAHHLNETALVTDVVKWNGKILHTHVHRHSSR